jgi:hypothetical protein
MSPRAEAAVKRLREAGCAFPVSPEKLWELKIYGDETWRELAREGLLQNAELYDGSLTNNIVQALEAAGVRSREHFRELYAKGTITVEQLRNYRLIGDHKIAQMFQWAGMPLPEALKEPVSFVLSTTACLGLQKLKKLMDLPTRDLVLECLIADAVRELEAEEANRKKK